MEVLYAIYQGTIYELDYVLDGDKFRLNLDNVLNKRVVLKNQLDKIHGKKFNAYIVSFDINKAVELYTNYMDICIENLKYELEILEQYREVIQ